MIERDLVIVLHASIEWIEALVTQLPHAFVAIARRRTVTVDPQTVEFIARNNLFDMSKLPFDKLFLS
jgi:hypothetical protein